MGQKSILISIAVIIFVVIFAVVFILSRATSTGRKDQKADTAQKSEATRVLVSAPDVINDPLVYDGLTVEVEAPITDWVTKRSFTVNASGRGLLGVPGQLLVVSKTPFKLPKDTKDTEVGLGETVQVHLKGRVRIVSRAELTRVLGLDVDGEDIKLDDNNIDNWKEGSILLLTSVEKL